MDSAERNHGRLFLFLTGVFVILRVFGLQPGPALSLGLLVGGVVLLGLPHGALDPMVAKQCFGDRKSFTLPIFYTLYVAAALLYTLVWWRWPAFGLASFLAIAAYHFGSDWEDRGSLFSRCAYGSTIVTLTALSHPARVAIVYEALGVVHPHFLIKVSTVVAVVAGCIAIASAAWRRCWNDLMEQLCIVVGAILLQPLLFFVCYFALLHSPRHLLHTARYVGISRMATIAQVTAPVLLATLLLAAIFFVVLPVRRMDERIVYVVFVGLAALTVPHMILERLARRAADRRNGAVSA